MKKVLIVAIPKQEVARPPGALAILASCCEQANVEYNVFDLNLHLHKEFTADLIDKFNTDFELNKFRNEELEDRYRSVCKDLVDYVIFEKFTHVAISVFTYASILACYELLKIFKQSQFNGKIIIGGFGTSNSSPNITGSLDFGQYALKNKLVDYAVYGEGDIAFTELLKGNDTYLGINQKNNIQILDLDHLPTPSYKKINPKDYFFMSAPEIIITGSRGCVRDCTFCDIGDYWNKYVYKSGKLLASELFKLWKETGVDRFDFSDSLINGSVSTFREFNKELIRLKQENPTFNPSYRGQFICRPSKLMPEQDYIEMVQAGADTLAVGIESFSESVRNHMRKKFDNASIEWHFAMCAKYGIKNVLLMISGYVTETIEDHQTTLDYLKKFQIYALSRTIYTMNVEVGGLLKLSGTPLVNDKNLNINIMQYIDDDLLEYEECSRWISLDNPDLTPKERLRRSLELIKTAYELGYTVLHLHQKLDKAERMFESLQKIKPFIKINPVI